MGIMLTQKFHDWMKNVREKSVGDESSSFWGDEYIYAKEFMGRLVALERQLHGSGDPDEIVTNALKAGCDFYQAEWCGVLDIDMELGVLMPYWYYSSMENDPTSDLFREVEFLESLPGWVDALQKGRAVIVPDVGEVKNIASGEYETYKKLEMQSLIGAPYRKRATGFVVVKNPARHKVRAEFLQMLSYVVVAEVNERKLLESARVIVPPEQLLNPNDVLVKLFGELEIFTSRGMMREADLKSPKGCRLLVYLLLNQNRRMPSRELAAVIWPEEETDHVMQNIRSLLYRLRQTLEPLMEEHLIETTLTGYCLNTRLNIMTDCKQFDEYHAAAEKVSGTTSKIELLKKAAVLYRGSLFASASSEQWLIPYETQYHIRWIKVMDQLLEMLDQTNNHAELYQYSVTALGIEPARMDFWYWSIHALTVNGSQELARRELESARIILDEQDYMVLKNRLDCK